MTEISIKRQAQEEISKTNIALKAFKGTAKDLATKLSINEWRMLLNEWHQRACLPETNCLYEADGSKIALQKCKLVQDVYGLHV